MATAKIQHVYECDEDRFWSEIIFGTDFNRELFIDHLQFKQWEVASFEESDTEIRREVHVQPVTGELPAMLKKVVGDNLGYTEHGVFDKKTKRYTIRIVPNRLGDKLHINAVITVASRGEGRCERTLDLDVQAKIFGVGAMVEKRIIADTRDSYDKSYSFSKSYLARTKD